MFYKKSGFPVEEEIVLVTVTKILPSSVFVELDEYEKSGLIHISEIAAGRIRNIRDYVVEGKKIVCKVLRINKEKGHIDLSLRRVNEAQRRQKTEAIKQEKKAEKIIEQFARSLKQDVKTVYDKITPKIFEDYEYIHRCFSDVVEQGISLEKYMDKKLASQLKELIIERIKPTEVRIQGEFKIRFYEANGVEIIKEALSPISKEKNCTIKYEGGGKYKLSITAPNYKEAEKRLETIEKSTLDFIKKNHGEGSFSRIQT
ncbi:MAG: S1 RNA-binding domain-containing protein [Candidatus Woesearchaeota archaeon]